MLYESPNFRLETQELVATLWFDLRSTADHRLTLPLLTELSNLVDRLTQMRFLEAVIIRSSSGDHCFRGFASSTWKEVATLSEFSAVVTRGQELTRKIAELPMPSIVLIDGLCETGGLEIALACRHIVAVNSPKTRLRSGYAEQGLIPCWGSSAILNAKLGSRLAHQFYLLEEGVSPNHAYRLGLVDVVFASNDVELQLKRLLDQLAHSQPIRPTLVMRMLQRLNRYIDLSGRNVPESFASQLFSEVLQHYHATLIEAHVAERRAMTQIFNHSSTRNQLSSVREFIPAAGKEFPPIRRLGCIGDEQQRSMMQKWHARGFHVSTVTPDRRWQRTNSEIATAPTEDLIFVHGEDPTEIRRQLALFAERQQPRTMIAVVSNSVTATEAQAGLPNAGVIFGMYEPSWSVRPGIIEIAAGEQTASATIHRIEHWLGEQGEHPICVPDQPGHAANLLLLTLLAEAVSLVADGFSPKEIDDYAKQIGFGVAPLEFCDQFGFDELATLTGQIQLARRDDFARPLLFQKFRPYGILGKKSGEGFYRYGLWKRESEIARMAIWRDHDPNAKAPYIAHDLSTFTDAGDRMIYRLLNEASKLVDDVDMESVLAIDRLAVHTIGWPAGLGGPLRLIDETGILRVVNRLHELRMKYGERFRPAAELLRRAESGQLFTSTKSSPKFTLPSTKRAA